MMVSPLHLSAELQEKHEHRLSVLREELDLRRKTEIHEVEEVSVQAARAAGITTLCPPQRKNGQIGALMRNHEKAFSDIKNYYNDITLNNLALINSLKVRDLLTADHT